jgi:phosphomethylpyrimidine synthase
LSENLLEAAVAGRDLPVINAVAKAEGVRPSFIQRQIASGRIVVMQRRGKPPVGIGEGLRTKINANIGSSA